MNQNCLPTIRSIYSKLSEKEKKIADYILESPESVIHQTINEVADHLALADATVFRFSKRVGFKGFQAMKIALASEIINSEPKNTISKISNPSELIFKATIAALNNTYELLDHGSISKAVDIILHAKRVQFFGTGSSANLALDSFYKFSRAGINSSAFIETQFQLTTAAHLSKYDAAVVISQAEDNHEAIDIFETIKKTGAAIISITDSSKSPINSNADVALYSFTNEINEPGMLTLRSAQLVLLDALYMNVVSLMNKNR
ncbi:MurR/RpiR family transcriptional regulator [Bacillus sp. FJAT-49736]|uniref:MurR/RpiR family transcriptional regulator n=1 Tax=Bacillus sp. FJAT-49736 TaxID=2833582 RepID=UPI001BC92A6D|nr:MurR/RpiR family transcriptional regulator [Bacillus sp. FJAT-49736]MBS4174799.1 MurR/RpiR family transcriptional regulator [Bacillus sp. FJAT-49736]MBS4175544.1 MurR/RpiR family transcriptional regulator [Bacillus sp. FJAT-49736]